MKACILIKVIRSIPIFILLLSSCQKVIILTDCELLYGDLKLKRVIEYAADSSTTPLRILEQYEYDESHLINAILIPGGEIDIKINELEPFRENKILVYCRSGSRSALASQNLAGNHNFTKIFNMLGGITEWIASGYPVWTPNNGNGLPTIKFSVNLFIIILVGTLGLIIIYYKNRILFINKN